MVVEFQGSRNQCLGPPFEPRFPQLSKHLHTLVATCRGGIRPVGLPVVAVTAEVAVGDQLSQRLPPLRTPLQKASESLLLKTKVAAESVWNKAPKKWVEGLLRKKDAHKTKNDTLAHKAAATTAANSAVTESINQPNDPVLTNLVSDIVAAMQIMQEVESRAAESRARCNIGTVGSRARTRDRCAVDKAQLPDRPRDDSLSQLEWERGDAVTESALPDSNMDATVHCSSLRDSNMQLSEASCADSTNVSTVVDETSKTHLEGDPPKDPSKFGKQGQRSGPLWERTKKMARAKVFLSTVCARLVPG